MSVPDVGTELDEADAMLGVNALYLALLRRQIQQKLLCNQCLVI